MHEINPACTSHTDRVSGVDVLPPPVAGAAFGSSANFSHAHPFYGTRLGFDRSQRSGLRRLNSSTSLECAVGSFEPEPHSRQEHSHLSMENIYEVAIGRQGAIFDSKRISVTFLCITNLVCG